MDARSAAEASFAPNLALKHQRSGSASSLELEFEAFWRLVAHRFTRQDHRELHSCLYDRY